MEIKINIKLSKIQYGALMRYIACDSLAGGVYFSL